MPGAANVTISNNVVEGVAGGSPSQVSIRTGLELSGNAPTYVVTGNSVTSCGLGVILDPTGAVGTLRAAVRDNTFTANPRGSLRSHAFGRSSVCLDITGNILDTNMILRTTDGRGAVSNVERFDAATGGDLTQVNTFRNGAVIELPRDSVITARPPGFCRLP